MYDLHRNENDKIVLGFVCVFYTAFEPKEVVNESVRIIDRDTIESIQKAGSKY